MDALDPKLLRDAGVIDQFGFEIHVFLAVRRGFGRDFGGGAGIAFGTRGRGPGFFGGGGGQRVGAETVEVVGVDDVAADGAELEDEAVEVGVALTFGFDKVPVGQERAPAGGVAGLAGQVVCGVGEGEGEHVAEDAFDGDGGAALGGFVVDEGVFFLGLEQLICCVL